MMTSSARVVLVNAAAHFALCAAVSLMQAKFQMSIGCAAVEAVLVDWQSRQTAAKLLAKQLSPT